MHEAEIARYNLQIDSLVDLVVKLDSSKILIINNYNQVNKTYNEKITNLNFISNDSNAELARATLARFRYLLHSDWGSSNQRNGHNHWQIKLQLKGKGYAYGGGEGG